MNAGFPSRKNKQKAWIFPGLLVLCAANVFTSAIATNAQAQGYNSYNQGYGATAVANPADGGGPSNGTQGDQGARIERLENEIQTLSRAVFKGEQPPPGSIPGGPGPDAANISNRLDQLDSQMREINGKLEEQQHEIDQMKSGVDAKLGDMQRTNAGAGYTAPPAASGLQAQDSASPPQPGGNRISWSSKPPAAAPGTLGTLNATTGAAGTDPASQAYEAAFAKLKAAQYDEAAQGFQAFLAQYPGNSLTGNAKYWLGETYYARADYTKAAHTFAEAFQDNPKGPKAADNLLKLGMSLEGMGKKDDACTAFGQIEKEYSATAGSVLQRAQSEMSKVGC